VGSVGADKPPAYKLDISGPN